MTFSLAKRFWARKSDTCVVVPFDGISFHGISPKFLKFLISFDGISPKFLNSSLPYISNQLLFIFSCCVSKCGFPSLWKKVLVRPHFKSGSKLDIKNSRPTAMLSSLSLLFERMLYKQFSIFQQQNLCVERHGFRKDCSTITQLLIYCDRLNELLETNKMPMTVYLDITKPSDTINYNITLLKLCRMGFEGAFLRFFVSYLTDRQQRIIISQGSIFKVFFCLYKWPTQKNCQWVLFIRGWPKIVSTVDKKYNWKKVLKMLLFGARRIGSTSISIILERAFFIT